MDKEERNQEIVNLYTNTDMTLKEIGNEYDLTPQMVNHICRQYDAPRRLEFLDGDTIEEIVQKYKDGMSSNELGEEYNKNPEEILSYLYRRGVETADQGENKKKIIDEQEKDGIISKYEQGLSTIKISQQTRHSQQYILDKLKSWNVYEGKSPSTNDEVFSEINEKSAYWIGFIMGDGCIVENNSGKDEVVVELNKPDKGHLEKLKQFTGTHTNITTRQDRGHCRISIYSDKIVEDLKDYGVIKRKGRDGTTTTKQLANNRHFWRGMVDADGTIKNIEQSYCGVGLAGCKELVKQFKEWVESIIEADTKVTDANTCYTYSVNGDNSYSILDLLYNNCCVYLTRKHDMAQKWLGDSK